MKRSGLLYLLFFILTTGLYPENHGHLSESISLFGDGSAPPVNLDSQRGWTVVTSVDLNRMKQSSLPAGSERKWRLKTSYEHSRSSSHSTVQVRLRSISLIPIFTHPWSDGSDIEENVYSNWYENDDYLWGNGDKIIVEARFITPPRTPVTGKIFSITLEAWDSLPGNEKVKGVIFPNVQLAYARPLPTGRNEETYASRQDADSDNPELSPEAALEFSLSFVDACINGDLPGYYRLQSDPVRSLDDGKSMVRYRLNPPTGLPGITNIEDYKHRYSYKIYSPDTYKNLFPEWFDPARPWVPDDKSFLFMGHQDRLSGSSSENVDYLVFLVEANEDGNWKVVARPGN